jgi:hypothetical protein
MSKTQENQFNVLWTGKPLFKPYLLNHIFSYDSTIQILLIGLIFPLLGGILDKTSFDWYSFIVFILLLCVGAIVQTLLKIICYRNTKYWITKDALYIQTGLIKPKVVSIQKNRILFIDIEKTTTEQKHNAGTVIIDDGELKIRDLEEYKVYKKMIAIPNPEDAVRVL